MKRTRPDLRCATRSGSRSTSPRAVGLGPFPGVLAIGIAYGGMLGKVYSEIFEAVNPRPLEALQSTGANKLQIFFYGWLPQVLPNFVSYTLYRWECAVRASAVLGLVGAGGLGPQITAAARDRKSTR